MSLFYLQYLVLILLSLKVSNGDQLTVDFYKTTCPRAEEIVSSAVSEASLKDKTLPAGLLRLHFHDCFVEGCDASVLINQGENLEISSRGHLGLRGFEVINLAKARLESECPGVVSCADIVAMAARDSVALRNGPRYRVQTGRRDGLISISSHADNIPDPSDSMEQLKTKFLEKGLTIRDLVALSAAHTIGSTACFFVTNRLYNFGAPGGSDPSINQTFLQELKALCPENGVNTVRVPLDRGSDETFDAHFLINVKHQFAVLKSDAVLYEDEATKKVIDSYSIGSLNSTSNGSSNSSGPSWESDFVLSMIKMGQIGVKTGSQGEIRRVCTSVN